MYDLIGLSTLYAVPTTVAAVLLVSLASLAYMRRYSLARPPVGVFNGRDVAVLYVFIIGLPLLYIIMPLGMLTGFLIVTYAAALSIGYRPVVPAAILWPAIGLLMGADIWIMRTAIGSVEGWQIELGLNSFLVLLISVAIANLYIQGGMKLQHVAWFGVTLALYDLAFLPFTLQLADSFFGHPLNPAMGMRYGITSVDIGLGDLLVYGLFACAALKAYGRRAAAIAVGVAAFFGGVIPASGPLIVAEFSRGSGNVVTPAQLFFGPAAMITYLLLRRHYGRERTFAEFAADPKGVPGRLDVHPVSPAVPSIPATPAASATQPAAQEEVGISG
jgi:hypothetical protein